MRRLKGFGCHLVTSRYALPEILRYGKMADGLGFDLLTVGDHTLIPNSAATYPNAHVILGFLGALTARCRLSTAVTDPIRRHPAEIAQSVATLDQLTSGRTALGIGAGEMMNLEPFGLGYERPYTRLVEAVEVIKRLWKATPQSPASYDGEIFKLRSAYLQIRPFGPKMPPVYIGALGSRTREFAGAQADGWLPVIESPDSLRAHLQDVVRGAQKAGRQPQQIDTRLTFYSEVNDDREAAYRAIEPIARTQLVQERSVLEMAGGSAVADSLSVQRIRANDLSTTKELQDAAARIPRKLVEDVVIFGTAEDCTRKLEAYLDAGATSFLLCNVSRNQEATFNAYAEKIVPYLRKKYGTEEPW